MSRKPIKNYLRRYRLQAALSQSEVSELLGISPNALSRYELGLRVPPADVVIASAIVFGISPATIFPALYNSVDEEISIRVLALQERLADRSDPAAFKKLALINGIPNRLTH